MRILTFQARHFSWEAHSQTLADAPAPGPAQTVENPLVVFLHIEEKDSGDEAFKGVLRKALKHIKWLANKRELKNVVLHSFAHLGGSNADPAFALEWMQALQQRLENTGYRVSMTPFGHFCEWEISVRGESLAKVWKSI